MVFVQLVVDRMLMEPSVEAAISLVEGRASWHLHGLIFTAWNNPCITDKRAQRALQIKGSRGQRPPGRESQWKLVLRRWPKGTEMLAERY